VQQFSGFKSGECANKGRILSQAMMADSEDTTWHPSRMPTAAVNITAKWRSSDSGDIESLSPPVNSDGSTVTTLFDNYF
jgi:hypothetical protein